MKRRYTIPFVLLTAAVVIFIGIRIRSALFARNVQQVRVGDSKEAVLARLGKPTHVFTPSPDVSGAWNLGVHVETWAYGKSVELNIFPEFPYVWPFKFRLFRPDADDVAIEFDSSGNVIQVVMPEADKILWLQQTSAVSE
jgi:hypothetical protein